MADTLIIEVSGFLVALIAIVAPIVKLNVNIAKLNATLESMQVDFDKHDKRIARHGEQIDELEKIAINHDTRIGALESKGKR